MADNETGTRVRQVGNAVIIDLIGDVTKRGQQAIDNAYEEAWTHKPDRVFFNFNGIQYINTSGIAVLISRVMDAERTGRRVGLFGMNKHYRKVFTLVRLSLYADLYEDENEALASL